MAVESSDEFQRHVSALVVVVDIYPEIMKEMISNTYPPPLVENMLSGDLGQKLFKTLTPTQQRLVEAIKIDGYSRLDIDLMYKIIRQFGLVKQPSHNWGSKPGSNDVNQGDDIERMRHNRNDIVHRPRLSLTEKENEAFFRESIEIAMRMDIILGKPLNGFQQKIENVKSLTLSLPTGSAYLERCAEYQSTSSLNNRRQINLYLADDIKLRIENNKEEKESTQCILYVRDPEMIDIPEIVRLLEEVKHTINERKCKIKLLSIEEGSLVINVVVNQVLKEMKSLENELRLLCNYIFELDDIDKNCGLKIDVVLAESDYINDEDQSADIEQGSSEPIKLLKINVAVHYSSFQSEATLHGEVNSFITSISNNLNTNTYHGNGSFINVAMTEYHKDKSENCSVVYKRNSDSSEDEQTSKRLKTECDENKENTTSKTTEKRRRPEAEKFEKLYRLLRDGENITIGLKAKDPNANEKVAVHVATGSKRNYSSQYISTCGSLNCAESFRRLKLNSGFRYGMKHIAEIDVGNLPDDVTIIDLRTLMERRKYEINDTEINERFHKYAQSHQEVLLIGTVPPSCLTLHEFTGTVPVFSVSDSDSCSDWDQDCWISDQSFSDSDEFY